MKVDERSSPRDPSSRAEVGKFSWNQLGSPRFEALIKYRDRINPLVDSIKKFSNTGKEGRGI